MKILTSQNGCINGGNYKWWCEKLGGPVL